MILTFKPSIKLQKNKDNNLLVSFQNKVLQMEFSMNKYTWELIHILGESVSKVDILRRIGDWPEENRLEALEALDVLIEEGIVEIVTEVDYKQQQESLKKGIESRQISYFSDFSTPSHSTFKVLDTLKNSHIAILGAGAIGSWICYSLVQLGIGKITLIDDDVIELSNLNRQALFDTEDIGQEKVKVLKQKLKLINPNVIIKVVSKKVLTTLDLEVLEEDVNLIVNCADAPSTYQTSTMVSEFSSKRNIPCINGMGYNGNIGRIGLTTIPNQTLSWQNIYENQHEVYENLQDLELVNHKSIAGSISPISMFIASIHTLEILKVILPIWQPSFTNKVSRVDFQNFDIKTENYKNVNNKSKS